MESKINNRKEFIKSMEATRKIVASWPDWKKNALGPLPCAPKFRAIDIKLREENLDFIKLTKPICPICRANITLENDIKIKCNHCFRTGEIKDCKEIIWED